MALVDLPLVFLRRGLHIKSANCKVNSCQLTYQIAIFQSHEFFGTHILVHCSIVAHGAFAISGRLTEVSQCLLTTIYWRILTSAEHWAVALASFSTGLVRELMVAVVYIHCCSIQFSPSRNVSLLTQHHT